MTSVLLDGLGIPESPRWHDGRLWFCNWTTPQILALDTAGTPEVMATVDTTVPYSIDWLPDGTAAPYLLAPLGDCTCHQDPGDIRVTRS